MMLFLAFNTVLILLVIGYDFIYRPLARLFLPKAGETRELKLSPQSLPVKQQSGLPVVELCP